MPVSRHSDKVCVYRSTGLADAHIVRDLLTGAGIPTTIRGENLVSLAGGIPTPDSFPTLWVVAHNAERARSLIEAMQDAAPLPSWVCTCGEPNDGPFASCWSCGTDRPDLQQHL